MTYHYITPRPVERGRELWVICRLRSDGWVDRCSAVSINVCTYVTNVLTFEGQTKWLLEEKPSESTRDGNVLSFSSSDQIKSIPSRLSSSLDLKDSLASIFLGVWIVQSDFAITSETCCFFYLSFVHLSTCHDRHLNLSSVSVFKASGLLFRGATSFEGYLSRAQFNNVNNISAYLHREDPGIGYTGYQNFQCLTCPKAK